MLTDNTQAKLMERKVCFISDASTGVGGWWFADIYPKANSPPPTSQGSELL